MDKLEYDSLHKFLVSLGLIFIATPLVILYLFFTRNLTLINQLEFDQLSEFSKSQITQHQKISQFIFIGLPIICVVLFILGVILLFIGIKNWKKVQKNLDAVIESDRLMHELDLEKMKSSEKFDKASEEVIESEGCNPLQNNVGQAELTGIKKYLDIEDRYFSFAFSNTIKRRYVLQRDLKIGSYNYDGIGISVNDNVDIIYEIKYWKQPSSNMFFSTVHRLYNSAINYEKLKHRNCRCILSIITEKESIDKVRNKIEHSLSNVDNIVLTKIEIQYIAEEDI